MTKKIKIIIAAGGTGGHVFPAYSLYNSFSEQKYNVELITDSRGYGFLKDHKNIKMSKIPSSPFIKKNILTIFVSTFIISYSILRSIFFLILNRPKIIFGMGGYSSLPICIAATILKIKFIIYENNLIIGKANRFLLPFAKKIFVSYKELEGVPNKYDNKVCLIGNLIRQEIINFYETKKDNNNLDTIKILVLGGSQAAKIFAEKLPLIFKRCKEASIPIKIYQQCIKNQNDQLSMFYKNLSIDYEIFNFSSNITEYFSKANLAITRSGASILSELTNARIPFISVPLPTSADNHQLKNAIYYEKKSFGFLIEEKNLEIKLFDLIRLFYEDKSLIEKIKMNQGQYSDKNVFQSINMLLEKIIDEKN
ncbi:UDP-N-acetylglucosamine--N-acetylmuramyl-(pentapeptide) pyrophosphoryl-undecaprenol N-acetylglucosamine transferase [Pelagibacteraceae bacterium]|jgi:UDP-N-acetylglucosamine--N-acetylmuramyl-(pentapeptide) pyrophosphoryl-undecaprenol N-acetylglucosamine transferase|nr:UDP-N-acetylglucosamine--N-acetylmuramyl-(pentapeptide) pyrophosphoryl-undecaprenol N-acetylglucosamine transferase [Pelagibacteraceae bacterium]MDC0952553.1 UDP-N-acetylglucosamine--N-acetylmuramyl-(pentapeptide) pyrophosphoryl-undecaprenol N-acetylglucosamine transferase [Pelagibacteraceae bacterium]